MAPSEILHKLWAPSRNRHQPSSGEFEIKTKFNKEVGFTQKPL
jgi:hypothetical protein